MPRFLTPLTMTGLEIRDVLLEILAANPGATTAGRVYYNSSDGTLRFGDGSNYIVVGKLNDITAPDGDVSLASNKITNLSDGTGANDAVNRGQLDAISAQIAGLHWKNSVRAATTVAGTLATSFENGDTIDGVVLATNDRILIKNQAAEATNGIYTVNVSGAPTRATDADTGAELVQAAAFVREGTVNADTAWVNSVDGTITLDTDDIVFVQFAGMDIPTGVVAKYGVDVGDTTTTAFNINHALDNAFPVVAVWSNDDDDLVAADVETVDANNVSVTFAVAPASNEFRVIVHG